MPQLELLFPDEKPERLNNNLTPAEVDAVVREIHREKQIIGARPSQGESEDEARQRVYAAIAAEERRQVVELRRR